jgi:alkylation response protein AidB-like acyl-CoA dehydrogenase
MNFLVAERNTLHEFLPGLDAALSALDFEQREGQSAGAIEAFRAAGGAGLLIPKKFAGLEASPVDAVRIQRALGSRAPSLAVATTMHHFSVATLLPVCTNPAGMEWVLLQAIAQQRMLLASGFAEGETRRSALRPSMQARKTPQGVIVSGSKKPCSLSRSMNLLVASVNVRDDSSGEEQFAVVLVPAESKGLERHPFWGNFVLSGAESDELQLTDVFVPERLVFYPKNDIREESTEAAGFLWFELLITASYVGVASALAERAIEGNRGTAQDRVTIVSEIESAMTAIESVAQLLAKGECGNSVLARALFVRYAVQGAIERATARSLEIAGGMAFASSAEATYLYAAARALAFHPPSRLAATKGLDEFISGGKFELDYAVRVTAPHA